MIIYIINNIAVSFFGMILSAAFCNIQWTRKKKILISVCMIVPALIQVSLYICFDSAVVRDFYPVFMQVPLAIVLSALSKNVIWPVVSVLAAYNCCVFRRWLGLLLTVTAFGDSDVRSITELLITVPLLVILLRTVAPAVRSIGKCAVSVQLQFGLIPVLSYLFYYLVQIYTDWFTKGTPIVVEFMSFVCNVACLIFALRISEEERVRGRLERIQDGLNLQIEQAVREIEILRESQQRTSTYRHDLRHHMQYLSTCIENERFGQAQTYIKEICAEVEASGLIMFCENEAANLIFSAYDERAKMRGIPMKINVVIPRKIHIAEKDLCVILSNALENALHACEKQKEKGMPCVIETSAYEKNGRLFFQFVNSCDRNIAFAEGLPVTNEPGHGIGVRSIRALVEQYGGIYNFDAADGKFILRISL